ncbi:hypothetical protein BDQ17DRAFT_1245869 [Cyathus striatus]|nr:hypothetical protein BDQ17DRAFT_1245869 [Cyathus striatus]
MSSPAYPLIDHSKGHAVKDEEDMVYYSPNTSHNIDIPPEFNPNHYLFRSDAILKDIYQTPIWWSDPYSWILFVPCVPSFTGIFSCLGGVPRIVYTSQDEACDVSQGQTSEGQASSLSYGLDDAVMQEWTRLESHLICTFKHLTVKYGKLAIAPPPPSFAGYKRLHWSREIARRCTECSRQWFVMWMGILSYVIAYIEYNANCSHCSNASQPVPSWYTYLTSCSIPETWLNGMLSSTIYSFSPFCPRTGVLVLPSEIQGTRCPNYTFFLDYSVPYWYLWGAYEHHRIPDSQFLRALAPPLSIMKDDGSITFRPDTKVSPIIWSEPLTAQSGSRTTPPPSHPLHPPSSNANSSAKPAWKAFLESHEAHYEARRRMETDAQHQVRINRERDRGYVHARVYEWQQDGDDYVRVRVHSKYEKELVFEQFSEQQTVYNAYDNKWDLCYEFGPDVESDEVEEDNYPETEYELFCSDYFQATTDFEHVPPPTQIEADDSDQHADEYECEGDYVSIYTLKYMYGFTPGATFHPGHVEYNWEHSMMALGYIAEVTQPSHVDDIIPIIHFAGPLSYGYSPHLELWDLHPENCLHRHIVSHCYRFSLNDYASYLQRHAAFLSSPRGRAALLMGGIVGRLACEHMSLDGVLQGPSSAVTNQHIGVKYVNRSGLEFCDDALTEDKMDIICGAYHCYTGKRNQIAVCSWWPLPKHWRKDSNGLNWGYWTPWNEVWYRG